MNLANTVTGNPESEELRWRFERTPSVEHQREALRVIRALAQAIRDRGDDVRLGLIRERDEGPAERGMISAGPPRVDVPADPELIAAWSDAEERTEQDVLDLFSEADAILADEDAAMLAADPALVEAIYGYDPVRRDRRRKRR